MSDHARIDAPATAGRPWRRKTAADEDTAERRRRVAIYKKQYEATGRITYLPRPQHLDGRGHVLPICGPAAGGAV